MRGRRSRRRMSDCYPLLDSYGCNEFPVLNSYGRRECLFKTHNQQGVCVRGQNQSEPLFGKWWGVHLQVDSHWDRVQGTVQKAFSRQEQATVCKQKKSMVNFTCAVFNSRRFVLSTGATVGGEPFAGVLCSKERVYMRVVWSDKLVSQI
jgi:hypothetical protein